MSAWPKTADELEAAQVELARRAGRVDPWRPPGRPYSVGAAFVAFSTARALASSGPRTATAGSERAWAAAVLFSGGRRTASAVVAGQAGWGYAVGYLALREGTLLEGAVRALPFPPDVLLVNATGRDHPRRAGLALHLGAVLDVPTVGVTDRPLRAEDVAPGDARGSAAPLELDGEVVGYRLRTRRGARPVCAHAGWRTDAETAREVVMGSVHRARTPEPLRVARFVARSRRARDEGRLPPGWTQDLMRDPRFREASR